MKTLKEYLINEAKLNKTDAAQIAQALVDAGNASNYSFWTDGDGFTGKYRKYKNDLEKFEQILVKDLTNELMQWDIVDLKDRDSFTRCIEDMYCGDPSGNSGMGFNSHDEILGYVEEVFNQFKI